MADHGPGQRADECGFLGILAFFFLLRFIGRLNTNPQRPAFIKIFILVGDVIALPPDVNDWGISGEIDTGRILSTCHKCQHASQQDCRFQRPSFLFHGHEYISKLSQTRQRYTETGKISVNEQQKYTT